MDPSRPRLPSALVAAGSQRETAPEPTGAQPCPRELGEAVMSDIVSDAHLASVLREYVSKQRGYASFFSYPPNRDAEEWGVAEQLRESMALDGREPFTDVTSRGRGDDPPDCEATNSTGQRVAIEITELVDGDAIKAHQAARRSGSGAPVPEWSQLKFLNSVTTLLIRKDRKGSQLKGGPYPGGYVVVIPTDETMLDPSTVAKYLEGHAFSGMRHVTQAFVLLSYMPSAEGKGQYPYSELRLSKAAKPSS